jgi:hypothetical protein
MERKSDKHSPKIDEMLKKETGALERGAPAGSRAEEERMAEAPADDEPVVDARLHTQARPSEKTLSAEEAEQRALIAQSIDPSDFPATRDDLVASARRNNALQPVIDMLNGLPADATFGNVQQVWEALGGRVEQRS